MSKENPEWIDRLSASQRGYIAKIKDDGEMWKDRAREALAKSNSHVDTINGMIDYLQMNSALLYTAITGIVGCDDPLEKISPLIVKTEMTDLNYLRNGIIVYVTALQKTYDHTFAMEEWNKFLEGGF